MNNLVIADHKATVDDAFARFQETKKAVTAAKLPARAVKKLESDLTCYLCVMVSGFLEQSIKALLKEYVKSRSNGVVLNYFTGSLKGVNAPDWDGIRKLFERFDITWRDFLDSAISTEQKSAVNSVVHQRNPIAHGVQITIGYNDLKGYYDNIIQVVTSLDEFIYGSAVKAKRR